MGEVAEIALTELMSVCPSVLLLNTSSTVQGNFTGSLRNSSNKTEDSHVLILLEAVSGRTVLC